MSNSSLSEQLGQMNDGDIAGRLGEDRDHGEYLIIRVVLARVRSALIDRMA
jgi:hypothetical protein